MIAAIFNYPVGRGNQKQKDVGLISSKVRQLATNKYLAGGRGVLLA